MNANENKKPIGFDMELTDEQLKDVTGGVGNTRRRVMYQCHICKAEEIIEFGSTILSMPPEITVHHFNPDGVECRCTTMKNYGAIR